MMIKWASFPSERSLRDYIHYYYSKAGFHSAANDHLMRGAKIEQLTEIENHVVVLLDEMKVREDSVFDKISGEVVGHFHLGDVNGGLHSFEVTSLKFPYPHFPTTGKLTGLNR